MLFHIINAAGVRLFAAPAKSSRQDFDVPLRQPLHGLPLSLPDTLDHAGDDAELGDRTINVVHVLRVVRIRHALLLPVSFLLVERHVLRYMADIRELTRQHLQEPKSQQEIRVVLPVRVGPVHVHHNPGRNNRHDGLPAELDTAQFWHAKLLVRPLAEQL